MSFRTITRRSLAVLTAAAVAASLAACGSSNALDNEASTNGSDDVVRVGQWATGAISTTALVTMLLAENDDIEQTHNIDIEYVEYSNLQSLYTDMATGRVDVVVGGPESFASSAAQGSPITVVGSLSRSNAAILSVDHDELSTESLRGKRIVAPTATSTWGLVRDQIEDATGLVAEKDYQVVTAESSSAALQQLAAGTADFAMAWSESLIEGPETFENIQVIADHNDLAGDGNPFIQFVFATNNTKVSAETAHRMLNAYQDQVDEMEADPSKAEARGVEKGRKPGTVTEMIDSGLMNFDIAAYPGPESDELLELLEGAKAAGRLEEMPPASFIPEE